MANHSLSGESVNDYRSQEFDHERSLDGEPYTDQYRRKETVGPDDVSELFHENTKLDRVLLERLTKSAAELSATLGGIETQIDPDYLDRERVELPDPPELTTEFGSVLESRSSAESFGPGSFDAEQLSQCLYYGVGQQTDGVPSRTYPSPGGLYPSEVYPVLLDVDGYDPGLYHYNHDGHFLRELEVFASEESLLDRIEECVYTDGVIPDIGDASVVFLVAADFWRAKFKYGPRGYRYVLQENGHLAENILLTLTAMNLIGRPLAAFFDRETNDFVGLDGVNEAVTYVVAAGHEARRGGSA
jgi:SagB-type dehydrogenase family enzyme